jgi:hypothetical protein
MIPLTDLDADQLRWFMHRHGVSDIALLQPMAIRAATVNFLDASTFDFDPSGMQALIFEVVEGDLHIDWCAWQPKTGQLASWEAKAFALGQDAIFNPATYFMGSMLRVHRTPLEWLQAERDGIVVVQPRFAHAYLRNARISCADHAMAKQLSEWIRPPISKAEIFIEIFREDAA